MVSPVVVRAQVSSPPFFMPCFHPLRGWRSRELTDDGKRRVVFTRSQGFSDMPVSLPCGQCVGCRLERSRQWAVRCVHEASLHEDNSFITLTYNNSHLPEDGSLKLRHWQLFMKRLRKAYSPQVVRFFHCGEYGKKFRRPHYHACLFGIDFPDKRFHQMRNGRPLYVSKLLEETWGMGFASVGDVTFESAAYVARYIMKKVTGDLAEGHYERVDPETGEITQLAPEYTTMSRRPGIGSEWFKKYSSDVFPDDFVVINGKKIKTPRFYDVEYEEQDKEAFREIRRRRLIGARKHAHDQTPERLKVRERVQIERLNRLARDLED